MGYIRTNGIVIREVNTGEADKIITILSRSLGKISAFAKSARRTKSSLSAGSQFLCYSDYVLFKGKEMYSINTSDIIEPFYNIRNDMVKLTYCAHMVDILNDVIQEEQPSAKVLQLFLNTLHVLDKTDKSPELLIRIFEVRFLTILGYAPQVTSCINCGSEELTEQVFSFDKCGILCSNCRKKDSNSMSMSTGVVKALQHIVYSRIKDLFSFSLSDQVLDELSKFSRRYVKDRLDRNYTKLDFLKLL
ncbi:MAG: repair protein RecO [Clostridiales bacterium]|jgi:DNA repair protein RecO (recombination protein O)|nr:repair protein RecO [Clostridiales bacterium]